MTDLKKLSTERLLQRLSSARIASARILLYEDTDDLEYRTNKKEVEEIKAILATRDHYPRGAKGRKVRQLAKQNR